MLIESSIIILHYAIPVFLISQPFTPSWEVVIEFLVSVVLTTAITLVRTVLKLRDNLYSLPS